MPLPLFIKGKTLQTLNVHVPLKSNTSNTQKAVWGTCVSGPTHLLESVTVLMTCPWDGIKLNTSPIHKHGPAVENILKFQISDRGRSKSTTQLTLRVAVILAVSKEKLGQEHQSVLEGAGTLRLVQLVKSMVLITPEMVGSLWAIHLRVGLNDSCRSFQLSTLCEILA